MKKLFLMFLPAILSLAMILPSATAVMADSEKEAKPQWGARAVLMIKAPGSAEAGNPVTVTVFERSTNNVVANAAVYARKIGPIGLSKPTITPILSRIMSAVKSATAVSATGTTITNARPVKIEEDVQDTEEIKRNGIFLGYTNNKGELTYSFKVTGHYILAAIKKNYAPGFARINIILVGKKELGIKAPYKAELGKPVTVTVFERSTNNVVAKASVYALKIGEIAAALPAEKSTATILTPEPVTIFPAVSANAETVKAKGIFIGYTDGKGQVVHSFGMPGQYILAALKDEYLPGFARIHISPKILVPQKRGFVPPVGRADK